MLALLLTFYIIVGLLDEDITLQRNINYLSSTHSGKLSKQIC